MNLRLAAAVVVACAALVPALAARGDEGEAPPKPNLREVWPTDVATTVAVPLSNGTSLVIGLPEHLWIQGPCNTKDTTSFAGDGIVLQDIVDMRTGNSHSIAYLGAIGLPKPVRGEPFAERFDRFVQDFVGDLAKAYARVDFELAASAVVKAERAEISVDGKPLPGWRTSKHMTNPAGLANKPGVVLTSEVGLVGDEASNSCLYLVSASKMRSLSLDQLIAKLSIQKTHAASGGGHRVQLLDISAGQDENYPVRFATYDAPAGFAPTLATIRLRQEFVYAEDRLDDKGRLTATWRITHRDHAPSKAMAAEVEDERAAVGGKAASAAKAVDLGTTGAQAFLFTAKVKVGDRAGVAATAVVEVDDKVWSITWTTFGDDAAAKADQAAFETLLHGLQLAAR
jgi:hypothetical protein